MAQKRKKDILNEELSTLDKVNLGADLSKDILKMKEKIVGKFTNIDEAIRFGKIFRLNLYNSIKRLKNVGTKDFKEEAGLDLVNVSFVAEDNQIKGGFFLISKFLAFVLLFI